VHCHAVLGNTGILLVVIFFSFGLFSPAMRRSWLSARLSLSAAARTLSDPGVGPSGWGLINISVPAARRPLPISVSRSRPLSGLCVFSCFGHGLQPETLPMLVR